MIFLHELIVFKILLVLIYNYFELFNNFILGSDNTVSIDHYIKYFTAIENYLKLFANKGEDFDIDKFNFTTWA